MPDKNWAFRKFYAMREFEWAIAMFGSANWTSTAYGECSHKNLRAHGSRTNNRPELIDGQVRRQLALDAQCCQICPCR